MGLMTPSEAFNPDRGEGLGGFGPEPEEMDEASEPEAEEEEAGEDGPADAAEEAEPMTPMSEEKQKQLDKIKEQIKKGKLKGKKLDEALKTLGYKPDDIAALKSVKVHGRRG